MESAVQTLRTAVLNAGPAARDEVLNALNQLVATIEEPIDAVQRIAGGLYAGACAEIAIDLGVYKALAGSTAAVSSDELASKLGSAPAFTLHLLRYLAAIGHVSEAGPGQFAANNKTKAFAQVEWEGGIRHYFGTVSPAAQAFPAFMKSHKYQDVVKADETAFQVAHKIDKAAFQWLPTSGQNMGWFMEFLKVSRVGYADWLSVFPVETELVSTAIDPESPLFVDVGGGFGHQAIGFHQKCSKLPGRVIVQDLPQVIEMAQVPAPLKKIPIDFFEGQPIKGAKFYYLRNILHDHPDSRCLVILKHLVDAMGPDSVILIDEMSLPETGASVVATQLDMVMISCLAAFERNAEQWKVLLNAAGLKIKSSYRYTITMADTVLVAVKK